MAVKVECTFKEGDINEPADIQLNLNRIRILRNVALTNPRYADQTVAARTISLPAIKLLVSELWYESEVRVKLSRIFRTKSRKHSTNQTK